MNLRRIGGLLALVAMLLLSTGTLMVPWWEAKRGIDRSITIQPLYAKQCYGIGECKYKSLMNDTPDNARAQFEAWGAVGLGLQGMVSITCLLLLIAGIIGLVNGKAKVYSWVVFVFSFLTLGATNSFKFMKPEMLNMLPEGNGYMVTLAGALMACAGCVMMAIFKDEVAQTLQPMMGGAPMGYGQPPPGGAYGAPMPMGGPPAPMGGPPAPMGAPPAQPGNNPSQYAPTQAMPMFPPPGGNNPTGQG